jgi:phage tail sheath protein FI
MPEFLSPGVFIEEVPSQIQPILAVSTSTVGAVGFTQRGPTDDPTLITSMDQYYRIFGNLVSESLLGLGMAAFFSNGGRRAYIVRVVPSDAVEADCRIQSEYENYQLFLGDSPAAVGPYTEASGVGFLAAGGDAPIVPGSITIRWREAGTAKSLFPTMERDGSTPLVVADSVANYEGIIDNHWSVRLAGAASPNGDIIHTAKVAGPVTYTIEHTLAVGISQPTTVSILGTAITVDCGTDGAGTQLDAATVASDCNAIPAYAALFSAQADPSGDGSGLTAAAGPTALDGPPTFDAELDGVVRGTLTISWEATATRTIAIAAGTASVVTASTGDATNGASITVDHRSGRFSLATWGDHTPVLADAGKPILMTYTPATATLEDTDDGAGGWTTLVGTVTYTGTDAGDYSITFATAPHAYARVLATYKNNCWDLAPISKGEWANDVKVQVYGNPDYYDVTTASYSRYNVVVRLYNSSTLTYDVVEQYEEISFTDNTSVQYFPDVINELSDYIQVTEPGSDYAIDDLAGHAKWQVLAGGDESVGGKTVQTTISDRPINPRSFTISWTDSTGTAREVTDDGSGNLTGDVDAAGTNTLDYTTGALDVTLGYDIDGGTLVTATYYTEPSEDDHYEVFGPNEYINGTATSTGKQYTYGGVVYYQAGDDGTFTSTTTWGRNQFTSPTLEASNGGMYALSKVEEILQVIIPDWAGDTTITGDQLDYAAQRAALPHGGDRFIIITTPVGKSPQEAVDWFRYDFGRFSDYAALYWPWIKIADPLADNRPKLVPPLGHIAGIYARTDATRNVGKAPGGTVDGQLNFLLGLEYISTQGERDLLYPNKINPLASGTNIGNAVWGVRTISSQAAWRYVNVRRLFMFLEKSVYNSTFWAVFEPNGPLLWSKISTSIGSFLLNLYNNGYFAGTSPSEAFFVTCDDSNNDQSSIDAGQVVCDIGVAPSKPAEFVRFRFAQKTL